MYAQRRDINEPEIVEALRRVGAYVQQMDKSAGFDLLVCFNDSYEVWKLLRHSQFFVIEVKNTNGKPATQPELEKMLTKNERETMQLIQAAGGEYHIVTDAAAALAAVI